MLFEMVAGRRPFLGLNEIQIMHKIMSVDIPDLPEAPDHPQPELLQSIFNTVTTKSPDDRYKSAGEMARAIHESSTVCGGMASTSELAQFLRDNMPERVDAIAARLSQYKTHATLNTQTEIRYPLFRILTQQRQLQQQHSKGNNLPEWWKKRLSIWEIAFSMAGLLSVDSLFGIGFGVIAQFKNPTQPTLSPPKSSVNQLRRSTLR